jgi:hypothetical protein
MRLAEGHALTDTAMVSRRNGGQPEVPAPLIDEQLADELLGKAQALGVELLGPDGLLSQVTKAVLERALAEEMTDHLGYEKHDPAGRSSVKSALRQTALEAGRPMAGKACRCLWRCRARPSARGWQAVARVASATP